MKKKLLYYIAFAFILVCNVNVYAEFGEITVNKNFSTGIVNVSGTTDSKEEMTVYVLPQTMDLEEKWKAVPKTEFSTKGKANDTEITVNWQSADMSEFLTYVNSVKADDKNNFSIDVKLSEAKNIFVI